LEIPTSCPSSLAQLDAILSWGLGPALPLLLRWAFLVFGRTGCDRADVEVFRSLRGPQPGGAPGSDHGRFRSTGNRVACVVAD